MRARPHLIQGSPTRISMGPKASRMQRTLSCRPYVERMERARARAVDERARPQLRLYVIETVNRCVFYWKMSCSVLEY